MVNFASNILEIFFPKSKEQASLFRKAATKERNKRIEDNTNDLLKNLRRKMTFAVDHGFNYLYYYPEDWEQYYGEGRYNDKEVLNWLEKWSQYDGYHLTCKISASGRDFYVLTWDFVDID
jgi:hypothetical protein